MKLSPRLLLALMSAMNLLIYMDRGEQNLEATACISDLLKLFNTRLYKCSRSNREQWREWQRCFRQGPWYWHTGQ